MRSKKRSIYWLRGPGPVGQASWLSVKRATGAARAKLQDLIAKTQRAGVTIYALNYSAWLTPFTAKPEDYTPPNGGMADYKDAVVASRSFGEGKHCPGPHGRYGRPANWFRDSSKLENDLAALGTEIHSRY